MSILTQSVNALGVADTTKSFADAVDAFLNADNAADITAAAGKIAFELSIGVLTAATLRPALSGIRLGLVVAGQMDRWRELSKVLGVGAGMGAGEFIDWLNSLHLGSELYDILHPSKAVSTDFNAARAWAAPRVDPLILDLNGNGIETVAPNAANPILFDHNGPSASSGQAGIKTGTGWVAATDGFLVLDRNGNGTIDNGTELFGDSTQLAAGGNAANDEMFFVRRVG